MENRDHQIVEDSVYDKGLDEDIKVLYRAIGRLNKIERVIILLYLDEYPYDEIAEITGFTSKNISVKIHRIKKKLHEIYIQIIDQKIYVMKEMNLERIWKEKNVGSEYGILLSMEQISSLRKKRERQLTRSVKSAVITGLTIKFLLLAGIVVFSIMAAELTNLLFSISALFLITAGIVIYDFYLLKVMAGINNFSDNIESRLSRLNDFLSVHLPVYHVENSLSSPILVIMGMFYYHFLKYARFEFRAADDIIVFIAVTLISYLFSFYISKYSLSVFRNEALELLKSRDEQDAIINYEGRRRTNRRKRLVISLILLFAGITLLILLLLT